jgi:hypothetical protein
MQHLLAARSGILPRKTRATNAVEFGYAGSGANRSAFPKARVVALAECGTHAFVAAEVGAWAQGEKTLANRLYRRLNPDELCTADRNFYRAGRGDGAPLPGSSWREEFIATCPSTPAVSRPALHCVTCRTLTSVFDQLRSIILCRFRTVL